MTKLSRILIVVIVLLLLILGLSTYYWNYYRNAYFLAANQLLEDHQFLEDAGITVIGTDNEDSKIYCSKPDKVIFENPKTN